MHLDIPFTVILFPIVCCVFPALLVPIQVYTVVWGNVVGTLYSGLLATTTLLFFHCIEGVGTPLAVHFNCSKPLTLTVCGDEGTIVTSGPSTTTQQ